MINVPAEQVTVQSSELDPVEVVVAQEPAAEFSITTYEQGLREDGVRTARHASEVGKMRPAEQIKLATVAIRQIISPVFEEKERASPESPDYTAITEKYWQRASRVSAEHGAKDGYELADYFNVSESRSYYAIKQSLHDKYPDDSLGNDLLDTVEAYRSVLAINPSHASTIVCELISKGRGEISELASHYSSETPEAATRLALKEFLDQSKTSHLSEVLEKYGQGESVVKALAKQSFYPQFNAKESAPLQIAPEDATAIMDVFDLQNKPYSRAELRMADDIAKMPNMQMAMVTVHERLIEMSENYRADHPERFTGDLTSWSEIFVSEEREDGPPELLPNPKLMKAISNNVLPAIAGTLIKRGDDVDGMTAEDITQGAKAAALTYKLLQAKIGLFGTNASGALELGDITTVVCPANAVFPRYLMNYLGSDYQELVDTQRSRQ